MIKIITKTLQKNSNVLEVTDNAITDTSIFEIYPSDDSTVIPQQVSVSGSTLSIIFDGKASVNTPVKIMINNVNGLLDAEDIPYTNLSTPFYDVASALTGALNKGEQNASDINDLADIVDERVPDETVLGGVLYHSTTGNTWKKLDAQNIEYDEQSTIYSAMGDIDDLETSSKNLVGAVNEVYNRPSTVGELINDLFTLNSGYSINTGGSNIIKFGNVIMCQLSIKKTTQFSTSQNIIGTLNKDKYPILRDVQTYGMLGIEEYNVSNYTAYVYLSKTSGILEAWANNSGFYSLKLTFFVITGV